MEEGNGFASRLKSDWTLLFSDMKKSQKGKKKGKKKKKEDEEEPTAEEEEELQKQRVSFPACGLFRIIIMMEHSHL